VTSCQECDFVYEELAQDEIATTVASFGPRYRSALAEVGAATGWSRPGPAVWSALEYASHVRDVLLVQRDRVVLAQVEARPQFARMNRDERVALCAYSAFPPEAVLGHLEMASALCAAAFAAIEAGSWGRTFLYSWPSPQEHDLTWLGRHTVHEVEHHLMDVRRVLAAVGA